MIEFAKRKASSPWTACAWFAASLWCLDAPAAEGLARAERPDVQVGDVWTYEAKDNFTGLRAYRFTQTVVSVAAEGITTRSGSTITTYSPDFNWTGSRVGDNVTHKIEPSWTRLQFPLETGKKYRHRFIHDNNSRSSRSEWWLNGEVVGPETVTTPAGTFETLKVKYAGTFNGESLTGPGNWQMVHTATLWYAPAVNRHVRVTWETRHARSAAIYHESQTEELVAYKPAKRD